MEESAYNGRPQNFPSKSSSTKEQCINYSENALDKKGKVDVKGGEEIPNDGIVYLQPDPTLKITDKTITTQVPKINGGYETQTYYNWRKT